MDRPPFGGKNGPHGKWEKSREITLETMKVLDEARRQLHIVFPADEKSQEKKKQKKTAKEEE